MAFEWQLAADDLQVVNSYYVAQLWLVKGGSVILFLVSPCLQDWLGQDSLI